MWYKRLEYLKSFYYQVIILKRIKREYQATKYLLKHKEICRNFFLIVLQICLQIMGIYYRQKLLIRKNV